jgi:hypothetical protein
MKNMGFRFVLGLAGLGLLWTAGCVSTSHRSLENGSYRPARFVQDRFVISFWVHPPVDERIEERYREIVDAGFNVVLGGPSAAREAAPQLDLCKKLGLKAIIPVPQGKMKNLAPDHPSLWGYLWKDEPSTAEFKGLALDAAQVRRLRPGKLMFVNLLPNYASPGQLGASTYEEYVRRFVEEVKPEILCMDHYPKFRPGEKDGRNAYCRNLAVMRDESLRAGIPFWNFFNIMPYGDQTDPTEAQVRWQVYASVAYGAKGMLYFCYYTPDGGEFPKGGAIIARDGRRTRHYDQARRLNAELASLGPTLMKLTSARVARIKSKMTQSRFWRADRFATWAGLRRIPAPTIWSENSSTRTAVEPCSCRITTLPIPLADGGIRCPRGQVVEIDKASGRENPRPRRKSEFGRPSDSSGRRGRPTVSASARDCSAMNRSNIKTKDRRIHETLHDLRIAVMSVSTIGVRLRGRRPVASRSVDNKRGDPVRTPEQWSETRRPEILELFRTHIYGRMPVGRPGDLSFEIAETNPLAMDGLATRKQVDIRYTGPGGEGVIHLVLFVPNHAPKPVPGFLLICNRPREENIDPLRVKRSEFWPAEEIVARGYMAAAFHYSDAARTTRTGTGRCNRSLSRFEGSVRS